MSYSTAMLAVIACCPLGGSVIALSATLAVSTQSMPGHSSSPKSAIALALAIQGFQTTVEREPIFSTTVRRFKTGSWMTTLAVVSR